jgi:hypothetical protein
LEKIKLSNSCDDRGYSFFGYGRGEGLILRDHKDPKMFFYRILDSPG